MNYIKDVIIVVFLSVCVICAQVGSRLDCPANGYDNNGYWSVDKKEGMRCILKCNDGYQPSGCHVLRRQHDGWNHKIPVCEEASFVSGKTAILSVVAGTGAVVVAPAALAAAGFTSAGVAAGSFAAFLQTSVTAAGGWFAACQSAGAVGLAATTKAGIGTAVSSATYFAKSYFSGCEAE